MAYGHKTPYWDRQRATIVCSRPRPFEQRDSGPDSDAPGHRAIVTRPVRRRRPWKPSPTGNAPAETKAPLSRWSCPELAREAVTRGIAESISASTVRRRLAADALKPWQYRFWIFIRDLGF
jgi:hypothetical protein